MRNSLCLLLALALVAPVTLPQIAAARGRPVERIGRGHERDEDDERDERREREAKEKAERERAERDRARAEQEARRRAEQESRARAERERAERARARAEEEARRRAEHEARARAERERAERERARAEAEARRRAEQEARERARAEEEARRRAEHEARARAERERAEREAQRQAEQAARERARAEAEARRRAEQEARERARAEEEARRRAERDARERERAEHDARERAKAEHEARKQAERDAREQAKLDREAREPRGRARGHDQSTLSDCGRHAGGGDGRGHAHQRRPGCRDKDTVEDPFAGGGGSHPTHPTHPAHPVHPEHPAHPTHPAHPAQPTERPWWPTRSGPDVTVVVEADVDTTTEVYTETHVHEAEPAWVPYDDSGYYGRDAEPAYRDDYDDGYSETYTTGYAAETYTSGYAAGGHGHVSGHYHGGGYVEVDRRDEWSGHAEAAGPTRIRKRYRQNNLVMGLGLYAGQDVGNVDWAEWGVSLGIRRDLGRVLSAEVGIGYYGARALALSPGQRPGYDLPLDAALQLRLPLGGVAPYVEAGVGAGLRGRENGDGWWQDGTTALLGGPLLGAGVQLGGGGAVELNLRARSRWTTLGVGSEMRNVDPSTPDIEVGLQLDIRL